MTDSQEFDDRIRIQSFRSEDAQRAFADDVASGLAATPKRLSCRFLYDETGSKLFEEICEQPEYYLTRAESEILQDKVTRLPARFDRDVMIVEFGSGSGVKTRLLLGTFAAAGRRVTWVPVDIAHDVLVDSARRMTRIFSSLRVEGIAGEYDRGIDFLAARRQDPKIVCWFGSNIGNLDRAEAADFLERIGEGLTLEDRVLLGVDLRKDPAALVAAYDDAAGVTARFTKNLLARINRELDGDFRLEDFEYLARWEEEPGRITAHLVANRDVRARIGAVDLDVSLEMGEMIHTESAYKYSREEIEALASASGYRVEALWTDRERRFALCLLAPA